MPSAGVGYDTLYLFVEWDHQKSQTEVEIHRDGSNARALRPHRVHYRERLWFVGSAVPLNSSQLARNFDIGKLQQSNLL
jgi:hypothetical protein